MAEKTLLAKITFKYTMDGCHMVMHTLLIFFSEFFRGTVWEVVSRKNK